jgi:hypothetical protein
VPVSPTTSSASPSRLQISRLAASSPQLAQSAFDADQGMVMDGGGCIDNGSEYVTLMCWVTVLSLRGDSMCGGHVRLKDARASFHDCFNAMRKLKSTQRNMHVLFLS